MFEYGSEFVKCDLHVHTKSEKTHYTDRKYSDQEYAVVFVQAMKEKDIKIVAITNHNSFNKNEYLEIKKEAIENDVLVLPGVEVSLNCGKGGIHVLVIFSDDCADEEDGNSHCAVERFLNNMYPERLFDEDHPVKRGDFDDLVENLEKIKKPNIYSCAC